MPDHFAEFHAAAGELIDALEAELVEVEEAARGEFSSPRFFRLDDIHTKLAVAWDKAEAASKGEGDG